MANGQQTAKENVNKFKNWKKSKTDQDFRELERRGILNRTIMASEVGFASSVFRQNPKVKDALKALEDNLRLRGVLPTKEEDVDNDSEPSTSNSPQTSTLLDQDQRQRDRVSSQNNHLEKTVTELKALNKKLEKEKAELESELNSVKLKLSKLNKLNQSLSELERLPW